MILLQAAMAAGFLFLVLLAVFILIGIPLCMLICYSVFNWILNKNESADTRKQTKAAMWLASFLMSVVIVGAVFALLIWYLNSRIDWTYT